MAAEEATRVLDRAFRENGLQGTPPGLERLLRGFRRRDNETAEQARRHFFFCRVFSILWFGNRIGEGRFRWKALPTYVYPDCLKEAIRTIIQEGLRDYPNPETPAVYRVTYSDLQEARWPGDA